MTIIEKINNTNIQQNLKLSEVGRKENQDISLRKVTLIKNNIKNLNIIVHLLNDNYNLKRTHRRRKTQQINRYNNYNKISHSPIHSKPLTFYRMNKSSDNTMFDSNNQNNNNCTEIKNESLNSIRGSSTTPLPTICISSPNNSNTQCLEDETYISHYNFSECPSAPRNFTQVLMELQTYTPTFSSCSRVDEDDGYILNYGSMFDLLKENNSNSIAFFSSFPQNHNNDTSIPSS
ncbi:protein-tyrosine phosphatase 3 [Tieghemostelium lacteum]|uniref:Protein-tyrosine phosphatase 3 n=1 Tax=Tieghemostelium lacteum TaxID=361077 RepID=A0A152A9M1_TIELA|nr:protein-tyrosine phosphatase 3 [Tieghemostelium lacteum]|eukprot:KYR02919.1 protein-tyrosine phosphatase 3 [Tieghemostelium lacteum]